MEVSRLSGLIFLPNILFWLSMVHSVSCSTTTVGNETDRLSLLAFKDGITQDPLGTLNSWNESVHFCEWAGVTCGHRHGHGRVISLQLRFQRLEGSISPFIGNLTFLRGINLQVNKFYGAIPQEIGRLPRLQNLSLTYNSLGGEIPVNLSSCSNLRYLNLGYNRLVGKIPVELGFLSKLTLLELSSNNLSGTIPPSWGNLSSLQRISLTTNALEGSIPDVLGQLISLSSLLLGENMLSGIIPPSLYNLSSLTVFSVSQNQLRGSLPQGLGFTLPNLRFLLMGANQFSGPIPVSLSNVTNLKSLELSGNNLVGSVPVNLGALFALSRLSMGFNNLGSTGEFEANDLSFLQSLTNCSNLEFLSIIDNNFRGELPNSVGNLSTKLTTLLLGRNQISGSIPAEIENLVNLTALIMHQNLMTGRIPITMGKLRKLIHLDLRGNMFSGPIPLSLGNLTQLVNLFLGNNSFQGSIPSSLGECIYLQELDLSLNNLNGTIPEKIMGLLSYDMIDLSDNFLTGSLPSEVGQLKHLRSMDIGYNRLSGEVPSALGDCLTLENLYMNVNLFQGSIPPSLNSLKSLKYLYLSHNNLSGQIPKYLETFTLLQYLNLSSNHLEGDVPREGIFKNMSAFLVDGNDKLCGGVPELKLPACPIQESEKQGKSLSLKVIITIIVVVLSLILISSFLTIFWRRKSTKKIPSLPFLDCGFLRVSYKELHKATGGYAPTNFIGVGSFGSVYKGILHQDEKCVAVKVLNLGQKGASKSFMNECEALSRIRHRNLLKIVTSCSSIDFQGNDFKALVYEFMQNGNLENWLHPGMDGQQQLRNLSLQQRLNITMDVASALDYLHHHCPTPVIHCDLKPSNILLDEDLNAHVGDFGLAKFLSWNCSSLGKDLTSSVALKGSIGYVPPEYGMGSQVSTAGDVYSYGILVLETFTGKSPTDDMFKDGLDLHNFSKMALPEQVMEIVDIGMVLEEGWDEATNEVETWRDRSGKIHECLASIIRIGLACSAELPSDRMDISDVLIELNVINEMLLGVGIHGRRENRLL